MTITDKRDWLDLVGRVNLTCLSTGATVYSTEEHASCTSTSRRMPKRFRDACIEYEDMSGVRYQKRSSGIEAVVMQQIFEVQRGLSVCETSLERTLEMFQKEASTSPDQQPGTIAAQGSAASKEK
jgi:hypothetical protein